MTLFFLAGLTPFGYAFIGLLFLSFFLAWLWLKSTAKSKKPGCLSIGFGGILIWFVLMFPTSFTFSIIESGNDVAKIGVAIFWILVLTLVIYFCLAKNTTTVKKIIFTFFKYLFFLIVLGLFLVLFFGMVFYVYQRLFTSEKNEDPVWVAFLCIFFVATLILAGFGLLSRNKEEKKKEKTTFYNLEDAKLKPELVIELDLSKTKLKVFPVEILHFKNLKFLILSHNEITEIPNELNKLDKLIGLDLSNNPISDLERNRIRKLLSKEVEIVF
ncbi:leucine-rich repeat domain-containing protein [Flavobacterium notoginsengisoli]|uniref:leucine-rich repeat domain-containing protein n=1 Tax=Flavobacterium notoginsengisoli TaxID=1478199 RepID=UPI0036422827